MGSDTMLRICAGMMSWGQTPMLTTIHHGPHTRIVPPADVSIALSPVTT